MKVVKRAVGLLILLVFLPAGWRLRASLFSIQIHSYGLLAACCLGNLGILGINAVTLMRTARSLDRRLDWPLAFHTSSLGSAINFIFPRLGSISRAAYLKGEGVMSFGAFADYLIWSSLLALLGSSWLAAIGTFLEYIHRPEKDVMILSAFAFGAALLASGLPFAVKWLRPWIGKIDLLKQAGSPRIDRRFLRDLSGLIAVQLALQLGCFWASFHALGYPLGFREALVVGNLGLFSALLGLTPLSLGIYEIVITLAGSVFSIPAGTSVAAALILRATQFGAIAVGVIFSIWVYEIRGRSVSARRESR